MDVNGFELSCRAICALRRLPIELRKSDFGAAEEKIGGNVEKVAQFRYLFVCAFVHSLFVTLIDGLRHAQICRHLHLSHIMAQTAFFQAISDGCFQHHIDKIIRIVYDDIA